MKVSCRQIAEADLGAVVGVLCRGFPARRRSYWRRALETLRTRPAPDDYPRFGFLLETGGEVVGVILLIFTEVSVEGEQGLRCNVSSWYVDAPLRSYATLLTSAALRFKQATYLNISPAVHTWPILQAQGYVRYSEGLFACLPLLAAKGWHEPVRAYPRGGGGRVDDPALVALLDEHLDRGCLVALGGEGRSTVPFVFVRRGAKLLTGGLAQLVYCRDTAGLVRHAGAIGRFLALRGAPVLLLDALGPIPGLVGRFFPDRSPKYYRGARPPRLNDLAYTEAVMFGV